MWPLAMGWIVLIGVIAWQHPPRFLRPILASGRAAANVEPYIGQLPLTGARPVTASAPRVCGKVVVVDIDVKHVDPSIHDLDPAILPKNASEIGTVAAVSCREVSIGNYAGMERSNSFVVRCRVELVDYASQAWLGGLTIDSEDLPAKMRRTGELHGTRPDQAIARWLSSLPRACG